MAIEAHAGVLIQESEASCSAAFHSAENGLAAAIALVEDQDGQCQIGLDIGEAIRALQLAWVGHPGQILVSSTGAELLRSDLPANGELLDLGRYVLADKQAPRRIYQLVLDDMPSRFPALRAEAARAVELPKPPTSFIGREAELANLVQKLSDPAGRLLTVVGPGGVGKTRLVLRAAAEVQDEYLHGVYFLPVESLGSTDELIQAITDLLDISLVPSPEPQAQLLRFLRNKELLLIFDSFEHLMASSGLLANILLEARRVKLMVSSRERLGIFGETLLALSGLPHSSNEHETNRTPAVELFLARVRMRGPDFEPYPDEQRAITLICQLLEGLPLGIELAAAWHPLLSGTEIAEEIQKNLDFLQSADTDIPPGHHSLRAVFNHSWKLLTESEQVIFMKLAVFRGGFQTDAALEVCSAGIQDHYTLVDKSLLQRLAEGRFRLHSQVAQFSLEKLREQPDLDRTMRAAHAPFYGGFVQDRKDSLQRESQRQAIQEIKSEILNIRAGWSFALENWDTVSVDRFAEGLFHYYRRQGRDLAGYRVFRLTAETRKLAGSSQPDQLRLARLLEIRGIFAINIGKYQKAEALLQAAYTGFERAGAAEGLGSVLTYLGDLARRQGQYAQARERIQRGIELAQQLDVQENLVEAYINLGIVAAAQGEPDESADHFQESLDLADQIADSWLRAKAVNNLGNLAYLGGRYPEAESRYLESVQLNRTVDDRPGEALALSNLGLVAFQENDFPRAFEFQTQALEIFRENGHTEPLCKCFSDLGRIAVATGHLPRARRYFKDALETAETAGSAPLGLYAMAGLVDMWVAQGTYDRALQLVAFVLNHEASDYDIESLAEGSLALLRERLPAAQIRAALRARDRQDYAEMTKAILTQIVLGE